MGKHSDLQDRARARSERDGIGHQAALRIEREAAQRRAVASVDKPPSSDEEPDRPWSRNDAGLIGFVNVGTETQWMIVPLYRHERPYAALVWWKSEIYDPASDNYARALEHVSDEVNRQVRLRGTPRAMTFHAVGRRFDGVLMELNPPVVTESVSLTPTTLDPRPEVAEVVARYRDRIRKVVVYMFPDAEKLGYQLSFHEGWERPEHTFFTEHTRVIQQMERTLSTMRRVGDPAVGCDP